METVSSNVSSEHENTESIPGEATTSAGNNTIITLIRFFLFFLLIRNSFKLSVKTNSSVNS